MVLKKLVLDPNAQISVDGPVVKSDVILNVVDEQTGSVRFSTFFEVSIFVTPHVTLALRGNVRAVDLPILTLVTPEGFDWVVHKGHKGPSHTWDLYWMAVDAGNL